MTVEIQPHFDFIKEAMETASPHFHKEKVDPSTLYAAMKDAVRALDNLDKMRKAIFYENREFDNNIEVLNPLHKREYPAGINPHLIHAILGSATEGGEKLDLLIAVFDGELFDHVGYIEEVGDGFWYDGIGLNQFNVSMEGTMRVCIDKLRKARTGKDFSKTSFNERDLLTERAVLEKSVMANTDGDKVRVTKDQ